MAGKVITDPPTPAEVQVVNDALVAALTRRNETRAAWVEKGLVKGGV